jgi:hypothetical protein
LALIGGRPVDLYDAETLLSASTAVLDAEA